MDLPLNEPELAAQHYIALSAADIEAAFAKWMRPGDFVRVTQGPAPQ
jgi:zinc protease